MIAVCIVNYNLPEMTDRLVARLTEVVDCGLRFYVLDNGSDKAAPARATTHALPQNLFYTAGMNHVIERALAEGTVRNPGETAEIEHPGDAGPLEAVWLMDNDVWFPDQPCPAQRLLAALRSGYGIVSPSVIGHTAWKDLRYRPGATGVTELYAVDWVCPMIRADALEAIWPFDPELVFGYGVDRESCYLARRAGFRIGVSRDVVIEHHPSTTYKSGVHALEAAEFHRRAAANADEVLTRKYGAAWRDQLKIGAVA